jgi:hypothetical protein
VKRLAPLLLLAACGGHETPAATPSRAAAPPATGLIGEYEVAYDGKASLSVTAKVVRAATLEVEEGADAFISDLEAAPMNEERWVKATRERYMFVLAPCVTGPCRLRYKVAVRKAAKKLDELEVASEEGDVVVAGPSTWLLTPPRDDEKAKVRFRVTTAAGTSFATGVYKSTEAPGAWDITLSDLWTAPYSVFGPLHVRKMDGFDIAFGPGKMELTDDQIAEWAARSNKAVKMYFGGTFPMKEWLLVIVAGRGRAVGEGKTLSGGGGTIFMRVGEGATTKSIENDWVMVHEMTHLTFPTLSRNHHWAEEGVATYVEPFARARLGQLSVEEAWKGVVEGVPQGQPEPGDKGIDRTPTWGRTYWGGALYFLSVDVGIRKKTNNKYGVEHALRGIVAAGGNNAVRWPIEEVFKTGDKAVGVSVMTDIYKQWAETPVTVDVAALWKDLGIVYASGKITFDDSAPSAAIRKAITTPD